MEGGSWTSRGDKLNEYNDFCKNIFNKLYEMSADPDCYENEEYKRLLKECEKFNPFEYSEIWTPYSAAKNKLIRMVLNEGGYYTDNYLSHCNVPENKLIQKFRLIINLIRYTNIEFDCDHVKRTIRQYIDNYTMNKDLINITAELNELLNNTNETCKS